ncbi:MAG: hypothetical protein R3A78_15555 [Polyangiales bacterium]
MRLSVYAEHPEPRKIQKAVETLEARGHRVPDGPRSTASAVT